MSVTTTSARATAEVGRTAARGTAKLMVYGTDVLESDGRVSRAFDAGAFAWQELVPGRQWGVTLGYEF